MGQKIKVLANPRGVHRKEFIRSNQAPANVRPHKRGYVALTLRQFYLKVDDSEKMVFSCLTASLIVMFRGDGNKRIYVCEKYKCSQTMIMFLVI